jgi:hypothetical protein
MRSKAAVTPGTVQHRFANWVVDFLLPTLRAQGYYAMPGVAAPDLEELAERRVYFEDLPEEQKEMSRRRVAALIKIDDAVKEGVRVSHALREVAAEMGWSHSTLWSYRRATFAVPRCDWDVACAPGWRRRAGGMRIECHPEALRFFEGLVASGQQISTCYRRTAEVAAERGWAPLPALHTLRRHAARVLSAPQRRSVSA